MATPLTSPHADTRPGTSPPRIAQARRWVVKIGSSLLTDGGRGLDRDAINRWVGEIATLMAQGREMVLVSSGAIAEGIARLGWKKRPSAVHELQAAAAVGQMGLIETYEQAFHTHGLRTAQILLTHDDLSDRTRYLNARSTLLTLLRLKVVPIINENDTVATAEIRVGDNDTLGALVSNLVEADLLVILTDQRGLYRSDPRHDPQAEFITRYAVQAPELEAMAGGKGSAVGTGGMLTKIYAARRAAKSGASTVIASGREAAILSRLAAGEAIGTELYADASRLTARKQWIGNQLQMRGSVTLDAGAARALRVQGASLLPVGVIAVEGEFQRGEPLRCLTEDGQEIARGLVNYPAGDVRRLLRTPSAHIEQILGYVIEPELIHRDNLVITEMCQAPPVYAPSGGGFRAS